VILSSAVSEDSDVFTPLSTPLLRTGIFSTSTTFLISSSHYLLPKMSHTFHVAAKSHSFFWDNSLTPVLTVDSGSEVSFDLLDGGNNQFTASSTSSDVANFDFAQGDPAIGPVYINGAEPGDVLKIEFLSLKTASYGWTAIFPGSAAFGLLADEFPEPALKIWDLETHANDGFAVFKDGIHIPIKPFLGVAGLAHQEKGQYSTIPPYDTGGNIDCKHITVGSTLYLPVKVKGALFSCGDGHAAQGDGEVCGTAIETPMKTTIRLTVEKGKSWVVSPHYLTSVKHEEHAAKVETKGAYAALGIDANLREASRKALRGLINWLVGEKGLTREESYILASVAADLKIAEAVDMPHYAVACSLPLSVFVGQPYV
jgi:acetamidase/formamidase